MGRAGGLPKKRMTMGAHLAELRNRLLLVVGVLIAASSVAYVYRDQLIALLLAPLDGRQLQYLTPGGGFKFIFTVVFFAGLAVAIPLLIQQLYAFLGPVLSGRVRRRGGVLLFWSSVLLVLGVAFGYVYAVPGALNFLYGFADEFVVSALTADSYLDFVIKYTLGLGLMFQIPLIMMIIHWIKPQKPTKLLKLERWVILLAFILAAIITPTPDPVNQAIIAVPIILIYQVGVVLVSVSVWRARRAARAERAVRPAESARPTPAPAHVSPRPVPQSLRAAPVVVPVAAPASLPVAATLQSPARRPTRSIDGVVARPHPSRSRPQVVLQPSAARTRVQAARTDRPPSTATPRVHQSLSGILITS